MKGIFTKNPVLVTMKIRLDKGFSSLVQHISHIQDQECINCTELRASKNLTVRGGGNHLGSIGSLGVLQSRYPVQSDAKLPPSYQFSYQNYCLLGIYSRRGAANFFQIVIHTYFYFPSLFAKVLEHSYIFPALR